MIPLSLLACLTLPGLALAGGAAEEEYVLDIPGAGGNESGNAPSAPSGSGGELPAGTEDALLQEGADGAKAARLARETGPDGDRRSADSRDDAAGGADSGSGIGDVVADLASGSDSGMGFILPLVLVLALAAAVALVAWRRRGSGSPQS